MINTSTKTMIILLLLLTAIFTLGAQDNSIESHSSIFEYKDNIASFSSLKKLLNRPAVIESYINPEIKDELKLLDTLFDIHAIFNIPISKLINPVVDLENEQNVFPRMIYTKDLNPSTSLWSPHLQEVKIQFRMGTIIQNYNYIFYKVPELREDGSFLIKWNLYKSIDGKFDYSFGSWYMKEIIIQGRTYTYVRNYTHYGIVNYPPYVLLGLKFGGKNGNKSFFKALKEAAE